MKGKMGSSYCLAFPLDLTWVHVKTSDNKGLDSTTLHTYHSIPQHREFDGFFVKYLYLFYYDYVIFLLGLI